MKNKNLGRRYFLISFLITFTIVTLVGVFSFFSGGNREVTSVRSDVPKNYIPSKADDITVLLIGQGENSRAYSLLKFSATDSKVYILSLSPETIISDKSITAVQSFGGAQFLIETLSEELNINISRYIKIEKRAFVSVINSLGSVYLNTENDIHYYSPDGYSFVLSKGEHILPSEKIYDVMRFNTQSGEVYRLNEQSRILCEIINQKITEDKIPDINEFFNMSVNITQTNISVFDFDKRLEAVKEFFKNGKAVTVEVDCDENFSLTDECKQKIALLF